MKNPISTKKMAEEGWKDAMRFSKENVSKEWMQLFQELDRQH